MQNKKIWESVIVVIVILGIICGGIYHYKWKANNNGNNSNNAISQEEFEELNKIQPNPTGLPSEQLQALNNYVKELDKNSCSKILSEVFKTNCIEAIEMTEKAISENNPDVCHSSSYNVFPSLRFMCTKKIEVKNE